jgi:hypothetical protein
MKKAIILGCMLTAFFAVSGNATNSAQQVILSTEAVTTDIPSTWVLVARWTVNGVTYKKYWTGAEWVINEDLLPQ